MDFVFGTLATDELKLIHHRVARRGVQHNHDIEPRDPLPGEPVTLRVRVGQDFHADAVACYYTTDGSIPEGQRGIASNGYVIIFTQVGFVWDTIAWGYVAHWQGVIPKQPEGTIVRYKVGAWSSTREIFSDHPELKETTERAAGAFFRGEALPGELPATTPRPNTFTYHVDRHTVPEWAKSAIIYQVFVDRFYPGDGKKWLEPENLMGFYGGTLWGVRDKLDYIADLGVNCIWLSPTFPSPTHHGYDITDYYHVEPRMGGDEALYALVEAAHARDIKVVLDLVCNHISNEHPYFVDALNNPDSQYRNWFLFDDSEIGYKTFFNVASMPFIDLSNPDARKWMLNVAQYWLREFDIDGYRLDHANGPGADFWGDFRAACREVNPECFCFGEVVEAPDIQREYIGRLDGLLDFHVEDALRKTFAFDVWTENEYERFVERHYKYFPSDFVMPTFLDNHDMDRFLYAVKGDKNALKRAASAQMRLPGPPIIYYGTEVGLSQTKGKSDGWGLEVSRLPMLWEDDQDKELLEYYKALIASRKV